MASNANINIKFLADLKQFSSQMQNAQRRLKKYGGEMKKIGTNLSVGLTIPLAGVAAGAIKAAADLETLETSLSVMTGSADAGKQALKDLSDFTARTPFQLEQVGSAAKQLLAFGFSVDEVKNKLQTIGDIAAGSGNQIGDVAQIFGQVSAAGKLTGERFNQLQERAIPIGSAIAQTMGIAESSVKDFITKGKVDFATFEAAFNSLATTGGLFAGSMDKQSRTLAGIFSTLRDNVQLALGELGTSIADSFDLKGVASGLIEKIQSIVQGFKELSPATKKFIVVLGGIAAAAGPLLALAGTILPAIAGGLAFLTSPIGLVVAALTAVGVVVARYWEPIKQTAVDIANYFIDLYNESIVVRIAFQGVMLIVKNMFESMKFVFGSLATIVKTVAQSFVDGFKVIGKAIKGALTLDSDLIAEAWQDYQKAGFAATSNLINGLSKQWDNLKTGISDNITDAIEGAGSRAKIVIAPENVDTTAVDQSVSNSTGGGSGSGTRKYQSSDAQFFAPIAPTFLASSDAPANPIPDLSGTLPSFLADADTANEKMDQMEQKATAVSSSVAGAFGSMSSDLIGSLNLADKGFEGFVKNLGSTILKLISQLLAQSIAHAIAGASASGASTGPAAVFTTPGFIASAVGGVLAAFAAIPKFADGGIVSGPTLALVGEYGGARSNPEVIAPLDKLKDLIDTENGVGKMQVEVVGRIDGRTIKLVQDRTIKQLSRTT